MTKKSRTSIIPMTPRGPRGFVHVVHVLAITYTDDQSMGSVSLTFAPEPSSYYPPDTLRQIPT